MSDTLNYKDNDISYGLVNAKAITKATFNKKDLKKEVWKPMTTLKWTQEPKQKLTL